MPASEKWLDNLFGKGFKHLSPIFIRADAESFEGQLF
jgi:hypothetical protein